MTDDFDVSGQVVLITGGGGGVGRLLALNFAKLNANIIIWDINQEAIKATIDLLNQNGFQSIKGYVVDISDREQVYQRAAQTMTEVGQVDILINNAGIVCCRPFWDLPDSVIQKTYNINIISHYWTVKAFLPNMMRRNSGHIVTVGSVTGMLGTYGCTDYSATKFACIGFHESLLTDLKTHGYNDIQMTLICPYYINTGMFSGVKPRLFPMLEPQYVSDEIVKAVRRNEVWCVMPKSIRTLTPLKCLLPAKMCWELMARVIRGPDSMRLYQGRGKVAAG
ncbi:short-chain dehydrogenase/reductase family 16C member 6 isoform X2 [Teleopsis dalmanni]|uniref:short-chain dehydrogenase/reductase family 16C member 6 isoform X2 n=1 Tax=Teleopsis dalmanni TaxID=139649 RepID=UPI0018CC8BF2|nr:short-chain dehydrogenase/reductase family 16C member 6 isoform X2 [Teleopsis dalmanni]